MMNCMIRALQIVAACCALMGFVPSSHAAGEKLYGVHWWNHVYPNAGVGPTGGWSVETVLTNSASWWQGWYFQPLYQQLATTHQAQIITRVDYNWGETVPAPTTMNAQIWANRVLSDIVEPLGAHSRRWVIGNEPNLLSEGNGWAASQITPAGYAQIYNTVRQVIKAQRPQDEVLFAPVSPGGVVAGVRWKDGNQWLAEAIDATLALPNGGIDGFAIHAYGNPFVNANTAVAEFRTDFSSQLAVIDSRQLKSAPVYMTEWNRATSTTGDLAANEQTSANFLRRSLINVDQWNRTLGNHNIVSLAWFVSDSRGGGWEQYGLEWWKNHGNPVGHQHDLSTALMQSSGLAAGMAGTRSLADFNVDAVVNAADYAAWVNAYGSTNYALALRNPNISDPINGGDYVVWRKFASAGGGSQANVPEPASIVSLVLGVAAFLMSCRARCRR